MKVQGLQLPIKELRSARRHLPRFEWGFRRPCGPDVGSGIARPSIPTKIGPIPMGEWLATGETAVSLNGCSKRPLYAAPRTVRGGRGRRNIAKGHRGGWIRQQLGDSAPAGLLSFANRPQFESLGMKQSGRRSPTALATVVVDVGRRMPARPPSELTDGQAQVWRNAVSGMAGDWLSPGAQPILIEFCRHVCRARLLEAQVAQFELEWVKVEGGLERFDKLLAMAERETKAITACARALRLSPSSQMHARTAARKVTGPAGKMPWD